MAKKQSDRDQMPAARLDRKGPSRVPSGAYTRVRSNLIGWVASTQRRCAISVKPGIYSQMISGRHRLRNPVDAND
jgi:hypothetical protein